LVKSEPRRGCPTEASMPWSARRTAAMVAMLTYASLSSISTTQPGNNSQQIGNTSVA
jgi:hypothetical protein